MTISVEDVARKIREVGVVPVLRASSAAQALLGAEAVSSGGIPIVEVTMTVPGAIAVISQLARTAGREVLIGAGTVLDAETAERCLDAGAVFVVSPGLERATVEAVKRRGALMMAGALTPSEVISAWKAGSDFVKIFPCGSVGGARYIKALKGPLPQIAMIPTGGVNLESAADFIRAGAEALGIGGELVSPAALAAGEREPIVNAARQYVAIVSATRAEKTR
jgi:2-dehydro-3-deoxyphosphogluconate aldolase / (4S)-4-hydroxy-2-oxoglutarate aldolase